MTSSDNVSYLDKNPKISTLYDKLNAVIQDHCQNNTHPVTSAEVVGTLEFLKAAHMGVYDQ